jgi:hypothetical protein
MSNRFDAIIKARVDVEQKRALQAAAQARQLKEADIIRELVREYLDALRPQSATLTTGNGVT